jgi:uncharacterized membrane protein YedE/YeeE
MGERDHSSEGPQRPMTGQEAYNLASDTVTGVNVRLKDNVFQGLAILVCLILGILIGALVADDRVTGAVVGGFAGLLIGLFGSGLFLMIYRGIQHARGRHR